MDLTGKKIAVTGATGFLGQYIVGSLLKHHADVIAVVRNPDKVPALKKLPIEFRRADLADRAALTKAFEGVDAVISNAGQVGAANFDEMLKNNLGGTENVFNAMHEAGIKRCVSVSSGSVYRYAKSKQIIDESFPLRSEHDKVNPLSAYPISKAMAESKAWELATEYNIGLTTIRPFGIFGAFDNGSFSKWFNLLMKLPVAPFPVGLDVALIYAGDVAEVICLMLENDISINQAYNVCGDELDAWIFTTIWQQAGGKTPLVKIPVPFPMKQTASHAKLCRDLKWLPRPVIESCREIITAEKRGSHW